MAERHALTISFQSFSKPTILDRISMNSIGDSFLNSVLPSIKLMHNCDIFFLLLIIAKLVLTASSSISLSTSCGKRYATLFKDSVVSIRA